MRKVPDVALSIRQPWAWAIIYAGKDCENRGPMMIRHLPRPVERRIAIHAAKGMTHHDYKHACAFMGGIGVNCPPASELLRGGIIGAVDVTRVTKPSAPPQSHWYCGPRALMLANAEACDFIPAVGALGYFKWQPADASIVPPPTRWMLPRIENSNSVPAIARSAQLDLIDLVQS